MAVGINLCDDVGSHARLEAAHRRLLRADENLVVLQRRGSHDGNELQRARHGTKNCVTGKAEKVCGQPGQPL